MLYRGQTELSWGALMSFRENAGPTSGAAELLLHASRSLLPLSMGSFARLLSSLVHSQVCVCAPFFFFSGVDYGCVPWHMPRPVCLSYVACRCLVHKRAFFGVARSPIVSCISCSIVHSSTGESCWTCMQVCREMLGMCTCAKQVPQKYQFARVVKTKTHTHIHTRTHTRTHAH